ncbi:acylphosphatase [Phanerochaete sordida]|uniref:Acylphosphatase n=1 Tax=Phanerochaete sordida TaxID=48140 RepID=A0A9P3GFE2_9APHY|nr:acylphosphatase [Phanerochaete sordida]
MALKSIEFSVHGVVQGVGFRYFVKGIARSEGLVGWVKNSPDGHVEGMAQGDAAAIEKMKKELALGPPHARVSKFKIKSETTVERAQFSSFDIVH